MTDQAINIEYEAARASMRVIKVDGILEIGNAPPIGSLAIFAVRGQEVLDMKVRNIAPSANLSTRIEAVHYALEDAEDVPV